MYCSSLCISPSIAVLPKPTFFKCFTVNCLCSFQSSPSAKVIPVSDFNKLCDKF